MADAVVRALGYFGDVADDRSPGARSRGIGAASKPRSWSTWRVTEPQ